MAFEYTRSDTPLSTRNKYPVGLPHRRPRLQRSQAKRIVNVHSRLAHKGASVADEIDESKPRTAPAMPVTRFLQRFDAHLIDPPPLQTSSRSFRVLMEFIYFGIKEARSSLFATLFSWRCSLYRKPAYLASPDTTCC